VALPKGFGVVEWRIPNRVSGVAQLMGRYELFYEIVDTAVNGDGSLRSYSAMLNRLQPLLVRLYDGDTDKVAAVVALSHKFRKFIIAAPRQWDDVDPELVGFLRG
jgi:hypothetical protein